MPQADPGAPVETEATLDKNLDQYKKMIFAIVEDRHKFSEEKQKEIRDAAGQFTGDQERDVATYRDRVTWSEVIRTFEKECDAAEKRERLRPCGAALTSLKTVSDLLKAIDQYHADVNEWDAIGGEGAERAKVDSKRHTAFASLRRTADPGIASKRAGLVDHLKSCRLRVQRASRPIELGETIKAQKAKVERLSRGKMLDEDFPNPGIMGRGDPLGDVLREAGKLPPKREDPNRRLCDRLFREERQKLAQMEAAYDPEKVKAAAEECRSLREQIRQLDKELAVVSEMHLDRKRMVWSYQITTKRGRRRSA